MKRITLLIVAALSTLVAVAGCSPGYGQPVVLDRPVAERPVFEAEETPPLVDSEVLEQQAKEPELIEGALASTTSTTATSTTTTTTAPTTTSPESGSNGSSRSSGSTTSTTSTTTTEPPATTTTTEAGGFVGSAENEFASSINSYRSSNGLPALSRNGSLDSYARSWAKQMAANGGLSHSDFGSLLGQWSAVGENIGMGYSVSSLFGAFVDSPDHQSNIVGDFTHVGIGVYQDPDGALWTTHVFAR
ncbi:MAG: CAP domain-containing protein [Actinomycetota bacterium]